MTNDGLINRSLLDKIRYVMTTQKRDNGWDAQEMLTELYNQGLITDDNFITVLDVADEMHAFYD